MLPWIQHVWDSLSGMDRNLLDIINPISLSWPSLRFQWSVSKAWSFCLNRPSFLFHRPIKVKVWVLSIKHSFFFRPEWGTIVYFLASPIHLFPAHYLREPGSSLLAQQNPCWCSALRIAPSVFPIVGTHSGPHSALRWRKPIFPLLCPFPFLLILLHLFIFLTSWPLFFFLASALCFRSFAFPLIFLAPWW